MPLYIYECDACKKTFEIRHSIKEEIEKCNLCEAEGQLARLPSVPFILKKFDSKSSNSGGLVKEFIQDAKRELAEEKRELKQRERE
jgi:putative FmdB family regulatory protein